MALGGPTQRAGVEAESSAAASYNRLLAGDGGMAEETWRALETEQRTQALTVGDRALCNVLRPRFLAHSRLTVLRSVSERIAAIMERAGATLLGSEHFLHRVGASEQEREIWDVDPGYPGFALTSRLDSFMEGAVPRFVEYNAESPAGIGFSDALSNAFLQLPAMRSWSNHHDLRRFNGLSALLDTLIRAFRDWGGRGTPNIAIVDWEDVLTHRDFELCAEYFREARVPAVIVDPRRLEYRAGNLWAGDYRVDLIYRRVLLHELLQRASEATDLLQAYRDGAVCMVNSPRSKLLHKKAVFALLSSGELNDELAEDERTVVAGSIPWTRLVQHGETVFDGRVIDLPTFLLDRQQDLALKPVDDYGGRGVFLGWDMSSEQWEAAIGVALEGHYVVQFRVPVPSEAFPVYRDGRLDLARLWVDTDPLLFRGELHGILTRISGSALLNVSSGSGSSTPTFELLEG